MKSRMKKILAVAVAAAGLTAVAKPSVEITKVKHAAAHDGTVEYGYTVKGDVEGKYKLLVTVSAEHGAKSAVLTNENVTAGSKTETVNVKTLLGKAYPDVSFFAELKDIRGGVQLWENGPIFAECNIGASSPEEAGYYFWWGDTVGYKHVGSKWVSVADDTTTIQFLSTDATASQTSQKNAQQLMEAGFSDDGAKLNAAHDAATAHWGAPWRMMTKDELEKLVDRYKMPVCEWGWTTNYNNTGVSGYIVKGKGAYASNSVFFPCTGYGSRTMCTGKSTFGRYFSSAASGETESTYTCSWALWHVSNEFMGNDFKSYRYQGFAVRPVRGDE